MLLRLAVVFVTVVSAVVSAQDPTIHAPSADPFAGAVVICSQVTPTPAGADSLRLVQMPGRFPFFLVQEKLGPTGEVLSRLAMVADHLIVKTIPGVGHDEACAIIESLGGRVREKLFGGDFYLVEGFYDSVPAAVAAGLPPLAPHIAAFAAHPKIAYAEPDYVQFLQVVPNDTSWGSLWGMAKIGAPAAWDETTGSDSIRIGVIDTGVDYNHADLAANIWSNPGETAGNSIDDDGNGLVDDTRGWDFGNNDNNPMDTYGHGTYCSGTVGAVGNNSLGVVGVCWNVKIVPLKISTTGSTLITSAAVSSVRYATAIGCKATSNSWGGGGYSSSLYDAIREARDAGVLFIAAAGNSSANNDASPMYPASYNLDNIIAVAATTSTDGLSSFSSYGATSVDLGAPGSGILSTTPGGGYASWNGTSMATPHVAGAVALVASRFPAASGSWIKARLMNTTTLVPALSGKCVTGGRLHVGDAILGLAPTVSFTSPAAGSSHPNPDITVSGTAADRDSAIASVAWTNLTTGASGDLGAAGTWSFDGQMIEGPNDFEVTVTDDEGHVTKGSRTLIYAPPYHYGPSSLGFSFTHGSTDPVPTQSIHLENLSGGALNWTASSDQAWCQVTASGTAAAAAIVPIEVSVNPGGLEPGGYDATITLDAGGAARTVTVHLDVVAVKKRNKRCGSVGVDLLLPLGILWLWRRRRLKS